MGQVDKDLLVPQDQWEGLVLKAGLVLKGEEDLLDLQGLQELEL